MVSVVGIAGIGKSRLSWEFYKYIDGLLETIRWHRGRCLAYGEGVTYWALQAAWDRRGQRARPRGALVGRIEAGAPPCP